VFYGNKINPMLLQLDELCRRNILIHVPVKELQILCCINKQLRTLLLADFQLWKIRIDKDCGEYELFGDNDGNFDNESNPDVVNNSDIVDNPEVVNNPETKNDKLYFKWQKSVSDKHYLENLPDDEKLELADELCQQDNMTRMMRLLFSGGDIKVIKYIIIFCKYGDMSMIELLTLMCHLDAEEIRKYNNKALRTACKYDHYDVAYWLISHFGLDDDDVSSCNNQPFKLAWKNGNKRLAMYLYMNYNLNLDVNDVDGDFSDYESGDLTDSDDDYSDNSDNFNDTDGENFDDNEHTDNDESL
jgi:hypothetical protein